MKKSLLGVIAALAAVSAVQSHAAIVVSEVAPWASGNSAVGADWFELTNTGASAVDISGWKVDDNTNSFAASVALNGVTSIAGGQSVVFIDGNAATAASFTSNWFGASVPAGFAIGYYSGSGVGLSTGGDAINIYSASGVLQANVTFGTSDASSPYQTFDNAAGANNTLIFQLSAVGINGAFVAANSAIEIGSPGTIAAVPEPANLAMMLAGLGLVAAAARKRHA